MFSAMHVMAPLLRSETLKVSRPMVLEEVCEIQSNLSVLKTDNMLRKPRSWRAKDGSLNLFTTVFAGSIGKYEKCAELL